MTRLDEYRWKWCEGLWRVTEPSISPPSPKCPTPIVLTLPTQTDVGFFTLPLPYCPHITYSDRCWFLLPCSHILTVRTALSHLLDRIINWHYRIAPGVLLCIFCWFEGILYLDQYIPSAPLGSPVPCQVTMVTKLLSAVYMIPAYFIHQLVTYSDSLIYDNRHL